MDPALGVALCWLLFGGLHVGLATRRIRGALVAGLGEWGYILIFSLLAAAGWALLNAYYAVHRFTGAPGLALGQAGPMRGVLLAAVIAGFTLATGSLFAYPTSPYALGNERTRVPRGLERVTRHPFFVGVALAAGAHTLLAPHLPGTVWSAGLALLAVLGAWHQDRKLLALRGEPYKAFLASTSFIPFAAIIAGRQSLVLRELPWMGLAASVAVAFALRYVHGAIFAYGGLWVSATAVVGATVLGLQSWHQVRRRGRAVGGRPLPAAPH